MRPVTPPAAAVPPASHATALVATPTPPATPPSTRRDAWIDSLRGLATLLVLLLHATSIVERFELPAWSPLVAVNDAFSPYRMAMLMMLSGLFLGPAMRRGGREFLRRKSATVLYPYLLWTALYGVSVDRGDLADGTLWLGGSYLWFILFLYSYFVAGLLLRSVPGLAVVAVSFALSAMSPDDSKYFERYFFLMGFFFLGHLLAGRPRWLSALASSRSLWLALPLALALSVVSVVQGGINYRVEHAVPTIAGIGVLIWAAQRWSQRRWIGPLHFVGRHSVVFFVIHYPLIWAVIWLCLQCGLESVAAISAVAFGVAFAFCWAMARLRERHGGTELLYSWVGRAHRTAGAARGSA